MSEGGQASPSGIINMFIPRPTLKPVMYWQGIVEIVGRGVLLFLLLVLFGTSSAAEDDIRDVVGLKGYDNAAAAAGFSIFVGVVAFIYEIVFILSRFLNFAFMLAARTIVLIVDISVHGVGSLLLFSTAVSMAYYADFAKDTAKVDGIDDLTANIYNRIGNSLGAAAFFAFMSLFGMIFLIVWMVLFLLLKWDIGGSSSSGSGESK